MHPHHGRLGAAAEFEDDSASADAARRGFGARIIEEDRAQYLTVGIQLGERYEHSPIVWPDDDTTGPPDSWDTYTPLDRPGARAPHFWLAPKRAAYDEFGKGLTLIDFGAAEGAQRVRSRRGHARRSAQDVATETSEELYRSKLVLFVPTSTSPGTAMRSPTPPP
jgi:hypothetical protein